MKAILFVLVFALSAAEALGQCGAQGGCGAGGGGGQRQPNNNGGRFPAPLIPPTTNPDLTQRPTYNPPAAIPTPLPPAQPPQIAQTPVKECACDQSQILALIQKLNDRNDKLEILIVQLAQQKNQPGPAGTNGMTGPVGPAGPPGAPSAAPKVDLDALAEQVAAKFSKSLRISVEPLASK